MFFFEKAVQGSVHMEDIFWSGTRQTLAGGTGWDPGEKQAVVEQVLSA